MFIKAVFTSYNRILNHQSGQKQACTSGADVLLISRTKTTHQMRQETHQGQRSTLRLMFRETVVDPDSNERVRNIPRHRCILSRFTELLPYRFLNRESFLTHVLLIGTGARRQARKNNEIKTQDRHLLKALQTLHCLAQRMISINKSYELR